MNKIFFVSGFLGSGKTTFLLSMMRYFTRKNQKVAIIVNELGEVGIDNQYLKQLGHNVWELFGGCICCTLSTGLEETLKELKQTVEPDIILVEPSGAAEPDAIYRSFLQLGFSKDQIHNFFILDPTRIEMFLEILAPLFHSSLEIADVAIINKIDVASTEEIQKTRSVIEKDTPFFPMNLHEDFPEEFTAYLDQQLTQEV